MRKIKFRGKSIDKSIKTGDWLYGGIVFDNDRYWIDIPYYGNIIADKDTIGQFTGLKDKNGKEIYEGDIIHIPENWEEYGWASGENYEIDFKDGRFRLKPKYKPNATGYDLEFTNELEVIGNIYDNPELLEV